MLQGKQDNRFVNTFYRLTESNYHIDATCSTEGVFRDIKENALKDKNFFQHELYKDAARGKALFNLHVYPMQGLYYNSNHRTIRKTCFDTKIV